MTPLPQFTNIDTDQISATCDTGAHERCADCECACHLYSSPGQGGLGEAQPLGVGDDPVPSGNPNVPGVGSQVPHAHLDDL